MTYWEHDQSVLRFQRILRQLGVDVAMRDKGVKPGDTVYIGEYELEWQE
jgi:GTP-binding protein